MKKVFLIAILLLFTSLYAVNYDYILVVDISGSMKKGNLDERVREAFKEYVEKCQIGDRIILMTFGTEVNAGIEDRIIRGTRDIAEIQAKIDNFQFNDEWTWMTKAFDAIGNRLKDLQKAYPNRPKVVLIFTDGRNEPPPGREDTLTFEKILKKHFKTFTKEKTFVYVVTLGVTPQREIEEMERKGALETISQDRNVSNPVQEIKFSPESFSFKFVLKDTLKEAFEIRVSKMFKIRAVPIYWEKKTKGNFEVDVSPENFNVMEENNRFKFALKVTGINKEGKYEFFLYPKTDMRGVIIVPSKFTFKLNVGKPVHIPLWVWFLPFGIILLGIIGFVGYNLLCVKWPEGYYVVRKEKSGEEYIEIERIEIRERQKFCKGKVSSEDLGFDDVFFELRIDKNGIVTKKIIEEDSEVESEISSGDNIIGNYFFEIKEV